MMLENRYLMKGSNRSRRISRTREPQPSLAGGRAFKRGCGTAELLFEKSRFV